MKPRTKLTGKLVFESLKAILGTTFGLPASVVQVIVQHLIEENPTSWKHVQACWKHKGKWSGLFCGESQEFNFNFNTGGFSGLPVDGDTRAVKGRIPDTNIVFWGNVLSDRTTIVGAWENEKTGRDGLFMADRRPWA